LSAKIVETEGKCLRGKTAKAEERAGVAKIAKAGKSFSAKIVETEEKSCAAKLRKPGKELGWQKLQKLRKKLERQNCGN
jgi:hypothetical protein